MKVGDKHLRLVFTSYSIIYIFMNYGPGNIPDTLGSDSSTSGQGKRDSDRLSDEERQRMLQEVQDQQADFGVGG